MSDFAVYAPNARSSAAEGSFSIRPAVRSDVDALSAVMAARGGSVAENVDSARKMIERLDVLHIAERDGQAVGWCGAGKFAIRPDAGPEWLIAGITVIPEARRQGVAGRLLDQVVRDVFKRAPGESIFSVTNAKNLSSIDLHLKLRFVEVGRSASYAGIDFTGGEGVLLRRG